MTERDVCDVHLIHADRVAEARRRMLTEDEFARLGQQMKAFADSTRLRILWALREGGELCVCDLAAVLGMNVSAVSQQLRLLRHHRLVRCRRDGKMVYYALDDEHVAAVLEVGLDHVRG